jgi:hypothetical protein
MKNEFGRGGRLAFGLALASWLSACGGGPTTPPPPPPTLPPTPAATVTAKGEGILVIHPSIDARFAFALETPVRITETTGGQADWNFARITLFKNGKENERFEIGADVIDKAGFKRVAARSDKVYTLFFRFNDEGFDEITIALGFADIKDGRQFTVADIQGWTDVNFSFTPAIAPAEGTVRLGH